MNPNRVRPLSNPCATFHSEWTASAVPSNNREEKRRRTAEGCCYYTAEFFTLSGAERKSCVAGAGGTTERALLCERWIGRGGRRVYLCCWTVTHDASAAKWRRGAGGAGWGHFNIKASLSVISWRWHCSKQQRSGWPREVFHQRWFRAVFLLDAEAVKLSFRSFSHV